MRQSYFLFQKAAPLNPLTGFLMVILLGAFVTSTYQPALAAEKNQQEQIHSSDMKKDTGVTGDMKDKKPCTGADPVICVSVAVNPEGNELGCNAGQQCSLSTQNKTCGAPGSGKTCQTEVYPADSSTCRCICKN